MQFFEWNCIVKWVSERKMSILVIAFFIFCRRPTIVTDIFTQPLNSSFKLFVIVTWKKWYSYTNIYEEEIAFQKEQK